MDVKYINHGIMKGTDGNEYICDVDGCGTVRCSETGELYQISARDKDGLPTEIEPLSRSVEHISINREKLQAYLEEEMIIEFDSPEECLAYFNTYDSQNFKSVEEMKAYQGEYGFGLAGKWYHINFDEALDVREKPTLTAIIESSKSRTKPTERGTQEKGLER